MIVNMALCGLKSLGAAFRDKLTQVLYDMNYRHSRVDPDVWMRTAVKVDGFLHYEYVLCYVENILLISHVPLKTSNVIKAVFNMKWDKSEPPEMYLGFVLQKVTKNDGTECWKTSSAKYLGDAINNVEEKLANMN